MSYSLIAVFFFWSAVILAQGNALYFTSSPDRVLVSNPISGASTYTFEAWFRSDNTSTSNYEIARIAMLGTSTQRLDIGDTDGDLIVFDGSRKRAYGSNIRDGNFHHLAITKSGNNYQVYLDGILFLTESDTHNLNSTILIGAFNSQNPSNSQWQGVIDEVRLWNYSRPVTEIQETMNCSLNGDEFGLVGYWNCDEGMPGGNNQGISVLDDSSPSNSNAALLNFNLSGSTSNFVASNAEIAGSCVQTGELVISSWFDLDCDGTINGDDELAGGFQFQVFNDDGSLYADLFDNPTGTITLSDIPYGTYTVVATQYPAYEITSPVNGIATLIIDEINNLVAADFLNCEDLCAGDQSVLEINTGIDENGNRIPISSGNSPSIDPFWQLINTPPASDDGVPLPSSLVSPPTVYAVPTFNGWGGTWNGLPNSRALNVVTGNQFSYDNDDRNQPWRFQRLFCLTEDATVVISGDIKGDDQGRLFLRGVEGNIRPGNQTSGANFFAETNFGFSGNTDNFIDSWPIDETPTFLEAGTYLLEYELINTNSDRMGFAVSADITVVTGVASLRNVTTECCGVGLINIQKIIDENCNGEVEADEGGGSGIEFTISGPTLEEPIVTTTDQFGEITLRLLPYGTYTITETPRPDFVSTNPVSGVQVVTLSAANPVETVRFLNCMNLDPPCGFTIEPLCDLCGCGDIIGGARVYDANGDRADTDIVDIDWLYDGQPVQTNVNRNYLFITYTGPGVATAIVTYSDPMGNVCDTTMNVAVNCNGDCPIVNFATCEDPAFANTAYCQENQAGPLCDQGGFEGYVWVVDQAGNPIQNVGFDWYGDGVADTNPTYVHFSNVSQDCDQIPLHYSNWQGFCDEVTYFNYDCCELAWPAAYCNGTTNGGIEVAWTEVCAAASYELSIICGTSTTTQTFGIGQLSTIIPYDPSCGTMYVSVTATCGQGQSSRPSNCVEISSWINCADSSPYACKKRGGGTGWPYGWGRRGAAQDHQNGLSVFPNPLAGSELNVHFVPNIEQTLSQATIQVRSLDGRLVMEQYFDNLSSDVFQLDVKDLVAGVYSLSLVDGQGELIASKRFVKQPY
ncbi:MAG: LamG-like jellyroll fold domain-containing protein [Bacteroidota bacterium]